MQMILGPDSLSPAIILFWFLDFLMLIRPPSSMGSNFQYGGRTHFLNFLFTTWRLFYIQPKFKVRHFEIINNLYNMAATLKYNLTFKATILNL